MAIHRCIFGFVLSTCLGACSSVGTPAQNSSASADLEVLASAEDPSRDLPLSTAELHIDDKAKSEVILEMARQLASTYVFSSAGVELEQMLLKRLEGGAYDAITDARQLARALTDDLRRVRNDRHLAVEHFVPAPVGTGRPPLEAASGIRKIEILPGNIGYLGLEALPPLERSRSAIAGAFAMLQSTEALIIDNRNNHGGSPGTVAHYVSYLSSGPPFLVSRIHFRDDRRIDELHSVDLGERSYGADRPVFVLDSGGTFSGGEDLSYTLQALGRAKIVGEVTGGGAHPTLSVALGHGLEGRIPFARSENPITRSNWEGVGVIPDVPVPAESAASEAEKLARAAIAERRERLAAEPAPGRPGLIRALAESPRPSRGANQVLNGDFSRGLEPWGITTWSGPLADGEHPHRLDGGMLCFTIKPKQRILLGWPPEKSSHALALERGVSYQLSFKASATGSLRLAAEVTVGHRLPPYTAVQTAELALDSSFRPYTIDVLPEEPDEQAGLAFKLAGVGDEGDSQVCIDDVALEAH
jgi:hypothetical protein